MRQPGSPTRDFRSPTPRMTRPEGAEKQREDRQDAKRARREELNPRNFHLASMAPWRFYLSVCFFSTPPRNEKKKSTARASQNAFLTAFTL